MSDQPHYPYRDGNMAVLGPDVTATGDGMTITWQGANYRRDHGEHVGAATPLICSDERHAVKVAELEQQLAESRTGEAILGRRVVGWADLAKDHQQWGQRRWNAWKSARARAKRMQADLDRYEEVLGDLNETLVDRAKQAARAEAALARVRGLAADTRWFADQLAGVLDGAPSAPATTRHVHVTITNRDEYTANRAALSLVDWIHAEFPGLQGTTDAREWTAPAATEHTPWCCTGPGYVSECPLCPQYGTSLLDPCPGHDHTEDNQRAVQTARLHAERRHPGYEYATTDGPRKQWDNPDEPPCDDNGDPDPTWEPNVDAGRPGQGWDRFDYHEEAYWRRPKPQPEPATVTDPEHLRQQYTAIISALRDNRPDHIAAELLRVRDRHLQQLRQRLRLADELLATRDAELAAAKKTARGIGAWGVLQAIEQALPQGPTVAECADSDRQWPLQKHGE